MHLNQDQNCWKFFYMLVMKARTKYYSNPNKKKPPGCVAWKKCFLWHLRCEWRAHAGLLGTDCDLIGAFVTDRHCTSFTSHMCNCSIVHICTCVQLCTSAHVQLFNCVHLHMCAIVHRPLDRVYIICSSHNFLYNLDQRLRDCAHSPRLCTNHKLVHKHQVQAPSTKAKHKHQAH